jgi:hypothetical protein
MFTGELSKVLVPETAVLERADLAIYQLRR